MKIDLKNFVSSLSSLAWTLPFLAFCAGFFCLQFFLHDTIIQTPDLVGKDILQATQICSHLNVHLKIIAEKEVCDTKPGMIITQNPLPHKSIKSHQTIFIVITKNPEPILAPNFIQTSLETIEKTCSEKGIKNRNYFLPTHYPAGQCFAQLPSASTPLEAKKMSCYISTGNQEQCLFPDFTNYPILDVLEFLHHHDISCDIYYKDIKLNPPYPAHFKISYQKPLAGTLVIPNNKLYVQLKVTT